MRQKIPWKKVLKKYPPLKDGKVNTELIWYLRDTYGIPYEVSIQQFKDLLKEWYK